MTATTSNIHIALVHFPVYNKIGDIVTSSVTTLDVHDISRIARTYGIGTFYVVTPLETQQVLVERMMKHWREGYGATYNPTRKEAMLSTRVKNVLADVVADITERSGQTPKIIIPDAKSFPQSRDYPTIREELQKEGQYLIVFGTGWGLEHGMVRRADFVLAPIDGLNGYNHLPVRAAIAIILDRLLARQA
ncbi:RNA methyltransferase [Nitrospina watsonii]|uniref:Methyltrn_RNA_4 domain-containing protein n=1 Tax=Nitrospina watsonii TaxID=1323948 RepID=A0ABN8W4H7_9BACT|nr:RNA methyltransferase [Nitrospina watsonii]CAI2719050.1 Methyltrn_RNA_4 domain-containing protein [Nitrospina watsonii]